MSEEAASGAMALTGDMARDYVADRLESLAREIRADAGATGNVEGRHEPQVIRSWLGTEWLPGPTSLEISAKLSDGAFVYIRVERPPVPSHCSYSWRRTPCRLQPGHAGPHMPTGGEW